MYPGRLLDISSGGAFVQFGQPLDCGAELSIVFRVRKRRKLIYLDLKARVVHAGRFLQGFTNYYGFGATFAKLSPDKIAELEKILDDDGSDPERKFGLTS